MCIYSFYIIFNLPKLDFCLIKNDLLIRLILVNTRLVPSILYLQTKANV